MSSSTPPTVDAPTEPAPPAPTATDQTAERPDSPSRRRRQRASLPTLLFFSFVLFMLTNRNSDDAISRAEHLQLLELRSAQLANYSAWLHNGTHGYTLPPRHPAVDPLVNAFVKFDGAHDPLRSSYYTNISGYFHGDVAVHNISSPSPSDPWRAFAASLLSNRNATVMHEKLGTWSWQSTDKVAITAVDRLPPPTAMQESEDIAIVHGRIELSDDSADNDLSFFFEAVHFISNGSLYGSIAPPRKHPDLRSLPSLVPESMQNATAHIVEAELAARIAKARRMLEDGTLDSAPGAETTGVEEPQTTCPFSLFAQVEPARGVPRASMQALEQEAQDPTGLSPVMPVPKMALRGVLVSAGCGLLISFEEATGVSSLHWYRKVSTYAGFSALVYLMLVVLLARQSSRSRTPAGGTRLSRWTFLTQAVLDSFSFAGHVTFSVLAEGKASISLFAPAFLAGLLLVYEVQLSLWIHQYQIPESVVVPPPAAPPAAPPAPAALPDRTSTPDEAGIPLLAAEEVAPSASSPANTPTPTTPIVSMTAESPLAIRILHLVWSNPLARTYVLFAGLMIIMLQLLFLPAASVLFVCALHATILGAPIVRAVRRGRTAGLAAEYIIGTALARFLLVGYLLRCPENVLDVEPKPWIALLGVIMLLEVCILLLQEAVGPTFFLPASWDAGAPTYDYHPSLSALVSSGDEESPAQSLGDCAICMDAIVPETPTDKQLGDAASVTGGVLSSLRRGVNARTRLRKGYSLAPCHHLFHTACLERWLAIKNICPQCRRPLPPL